MIFCRWLGCVCPENLPDWPTIMAWILPWKIDPCKKQLQWIIRQIWYESFLATVKCYWQKELTPNCCINSCVIPVWKRVGGVQCLEMDFLGPEMDMFWVLWDAIYTPDRTSYTQGPGWWIKIPAPPPKS